MATSTEMKQSIAAGQYDAAFRNLYGKDDKTVEVQRARYIHALDRFEHYFGTGRTVRLYSAPGRTEIGGNHTDHNNGVVMAAGGDGAFRRADSRCGSRVCQCRRQGWRL